MQAGNSQLESKVHSAGEKTAHFEAQQKKLLTEIRILELPRFEVITLILEEVNRRRNNSIDLALLSEKVSRLESLLASFSEELILMAIDN